MKVLDRYKQRSKDFHAGYEKGLQSGINAAIKVMMFSIIQFLGDKRGWKRERIFEGCQWLRKHAVMMNEELTSFDEVVEAVREEYGIVERDGKFYLLSEKEWKEGGK